MNESNELKAEVQSQTEEIKPSVEKAGLGKRTIAGIIDLFIMLFIAISLFNLAVVPLFNLSSNVKQVQSDLNQLMLDSHLYNWNEDSKAFELVDESKYIESAQYYVENYCINTTTEGACSAIKGKNTLAEVVYEYKNSSDKYVFRDFYNDNFEYIGEADKQKEIEKQVYYLVGNYFRASDAYTKLNNKYSLYFNAEAYISLFIASALTYLLVPMLTKNGKTFGKMMFQLSLANAKGYKIKKSQIVVRFLSFFVVNILLGIMTMFILPFISFTIMVFSKKNNTIHDYLSATMVIDDRFSLIYNNENEHLESLKRQENDQEEIILNRQKIKDKKGQDKN